MQQTLMSHTNYVLVISAVSLLVIQLVKSPTKLYDLSTRKVFTSRDVVFYETIFPYALNNNETSLPTTTTLPFPALDLDNNVVAEQSIVGSETEKTIAKSPTLQKLLLLLLPKPTCTFQVQPTDRPLLAIDRLCQPFDAPSISPNQSPLSPLPAPTVPAIAPPPEAPLCRSSHTTAPLIKMRDYVCSNITLSSPGQFSSLSPGPTKSTRYPLSHYVSYDRYTLGYCSIVAQINQTIEPNTYVEVAPHPEWQEAMRSELQAFHDNGTWSITPLLAGKTPIDCR